MGSLVYNNTKTAFFLILIVLIIFISHSPIEAQNILKNPSFEEIVDNKPLNWDFDVWNKDSKGFRFGFDTRLPHSGKQAIVIEATEPNDLKITQKIAVIPETIYKFSCFVNASKIPTGNKGANLSALDILDTSESLYETHGQWKELIFYGKTLKGQKEVIFTLRLGGYGSLNKGIVAFDDCKVEIVQNPPTAVAIAPLMRDKESSPSKPSLTDSASSLLITSFFSILFISLMLLCFKYVENKDIDALRYNEKTFLYFLLILSSTLKIILSFLTTGFPVDMITYKAWSDLLVKKGIAEFYFSGHFVDYPPFYMYVFYTIGFLRNLLDIPYDSQLFILLLKTPSIIAESLSLVLIYQVAKAVEVKRGSLHMLLILFAINPVLIINTCLWGQVDSFLSLFITASIVMLWQKRIVLSSILFTLSILTKPQALMYTPLFLLYYYHIKDYKAICKAIALSLLTAIVVITPFSINHGPYWIIKIFKNALVQYPFATLNAFNIHALFGNNWAPVMDKWIIFSFKTWGNFFILVITATSALFYFKSKYSNKIPLIALFIVISVFMFSTEMHERYMVPAFLIFAVVFLLTKDRAILYLFAGFTITNTFNLSYTLILAHHGIYHLSPNDFILRTFSFFNLILYYLTVKRIVLILLGRLDIKTTNDNKKEPIDNLPLIQLNTIISLKDLIAIGLVSIFFGLIYFNNLGNKVSPQTYWKPSARGEGLFIDFKKPQDISMITYFYGIGNGRFRIDLSDDFINWKSLPPIETKGVFMWKSQKLDIKTHYLSIITEELSPTLYEIGFFDKSGNIIKNVSASSFVVMKETKGSFHNLFDEQELVPKRPSYLNSMYFDEIYFARTAFEHIHGIEPYENTHPPLGKLIMAVGIKLFGMTPFGWRFCCAMFGILLIILMYLMGKLLFGQIKYGIFTSLLTGFDFMTFAQSRIGTVDIMAVTFIVAMYYFMFRFFVSDNDKSLRYLALSGISFGFGASVKWLCIYSGLGLAVIFFYKLYKEWKSHRPVFIKYISWGTICFVLIPVVIYLMTFIPFMMLPGEGHDFASVLKLQEHMYQYHKSAKGSHPFASSWWQWPIILKPMWFYMGQDLPPSKAESIVSMGNPLIWWIGSLSVIYLLYLIFIKRMTTLIIIFILVAFASNYLPWMLVPRETYIYHFFASVPFLILSVLYVIQHIKIEKISPPYITLAYISCVVGLFVLFYPILSGMTIDKSYIAQYLKWFNSWIFFVP